jgi:hypothetical protein
LFVPDNADALPSNLAAAHAMIRAERAARQEIEARASERKPNGIRAEAPPQTLKPSSLI